MEDDDDDDDMVIAQHMQNDPSFSPPFSTLPQNTSVSNVKF